ncbi:hypothetical protein RRG08_008671 [Elysia crispata]|uniref:Uncharacterized protein n=1 Tax=Elysia crispata TaxID=231223 RepID=A0AAE1CP57_9GAST|nr:hypothetical protein RRG08_008671 [Elysia crispata]
MVDVLRATRRLAGSDEERTLVLTTTTILRVVPTNYLCDKIIGDFGPLLSLSAARRVDGMYLRLLFFCTSDGSIPCVSGPRPAQLLFPAIDRWKCLALSDRVLARKPARCSSTHTPPRKGKKKDMYQTNDEAPTQLHVVSHEEPLICDFVCYNPSTEITANHIWHSSNPLPPADGLRQSPVGGDPRRNKPQDIAGRSALPLHRRWKLLEGERSLCS